MLFFNHLPYSAVIIRAISVGNTTFRYHSSLSNQPSNAYIHQKKLLYRVLKWWVRLALPIFCRRIYISDPALLKLKGPLLLACNHPNSFLDSILLDALFHQPIWSLARGDAFRKKSTAGVLRKLRILPVYRTSEGVENLQENYRTFADCIALFQQQQIVCIFSEGKCINEWHLRPLKKGTARLALKAWQQQIPLTVLPVGINYSSFRKFGKNVWINFGTPITEAAIDGTQSEGLQHGQFNAQLKQQLEQLVIEIPRNKPQLQAQLSVAVAPWLKVLLAIPALFGFLLHAPLYLPIKHFTWKRTHSNDHFDSVLFALLLLTYPLYLLLIGLLLWALVPWQYAWELFLLLPFFAWAYVQVKSQAD